MNEQVNRLKRKRGEDAPNYKVALRILFPSHIARNIIGSDPIGSNIQRLRDHHKTDIHILHCSGPDSILTITANLNAALACLIDIVPHLEGKPFVGEDGRTEFGTQLQLLIEEYRIGCIIGRQGNKIKEMNKLDGIVKVEIFPECCPRSTERVIRVIGGVIEAVYCIGKISETIRSNRSRYKGETIPYDPFQAVPKDAGEYGGCTVDCYSHGGMAGCSIKGGGRGGGRYGRGATGRGRGGGSGRGSGSGSGVECVRGGGRARFGCRGGFDNCGDWRGRYRRRMRGQTRGTFNFAQRPITGLVIHGLLFNHDNKSTFQVNVRRDKVGRIMGQYGQKIKRTRQCSGASILIETPPAGAKDRIILITGSRQQIDLVLLFFQKDIITV